jgi:protein dithiol oxidoreductase (disulfide-forming)
MNKLLSMAFLCLILPQTGVAGFEEGKHYYEVSFNQPVETGDKIEVREFFWYGCPHCYDLEPVLTRWLKRLPANAGFVRTPGVAPRWLIHAQAYYALDSLGAAEKLHAAFFDAMHKQKRKLPDEAALMQFVAEHGVDSKQFQQAFNSFGVRLKLERAKRLNQDLGIASVPSFVVDGKYLTSPSMAGGEREVLEVMSYLIQKAARERRRKP